MAANFTMAPSEVVELEPIYNNVITQSESMKKEFYNLSTTPVQRYQLKFNVLTTTEKDTLIAHFKSCYGGYDSFSWTSVPSYIESGVNITGRWVDGSLSLSSVSNKYWMCSIIMEKDI